MKQQQARTRLLAGIPVAERRTELAGVSTAVLEGGAGPPVVLLHGPGGTGADWVWTIAGLVASRRVVAPDLPGQGGSEVAGGPIDAELVLAWLDELIDDTCPSPPALVGNALGGAVAARFAADRGERLSGLVLVDTFGLTGFEPVPEFGRAVYDFLARPDERTHEQLWRYCAFDLDGLRSRIGERWGPFQAYNLELARTPSVAAAFGALMEEFGVRAIPASELERIAVPTALVWGRHDLATPLAVAEAASARYGWPLHVIEDAADAPPIEQPEAFLRALNAALRASTAVEASA
jgi:pimeloyl-ACP methyl ester carboxylesterase